MRRVLSLARAAMETAPVSKAKLIVTEGGRDRVHELFDERTVIGRGASADLILRTESASAQHCEVVDTGSGFRIVDLETLQGTEVNGKPINQHLLANGDTIRIGDARITFLGTSAAAGPKPRHESPAVLTELPVDEDGNPKRFYRHESRKRNDQSWVTGAVIGGIVVLLGVVVVMLASSNPGEAERQRFAEAQTVAKRGDETSLKRALVILKDIPPGTVDERRMETFREQVEFQLSEIEVQKENEQAEAFRDQVMDQLGVFTDDESKASFLRRRIDAFRAEFPDNPIAKELEKKLDDLIGSPATGEDAMENETWWRMQRSKIQAAFDYGDWLEAYQLLVAAENDEIRSAALATKIATMREIYESKYGTFYERQIEMASDARVAGRAREAKAILGRLVKIPLEPFQSRAQRLLDQIQD